MRTIPAYLRHGHRYYFEVDNIGSKPIFKPIAVHLQGREPLFAEFKENSDCATFAHIVGDIQKCKYEYYLLHSSFSYFERKPFEDVIEKRSCELFKMGNNTPILIKYDVLNPSSEKMIGTYSVTRDTAYFINTVKKEKEKYPTLKRKIKKKEMSGSKFEVFCVGTFKNVY
ncbi:hypothetical protein RB195_007653 [Necator americanus]|uniref:Uncharacterized protein n=1 Tax=Necator americanus TaxID=51031 RepID=A0ABR1C1P7_NECAM